jgi:hypothetical protein
MVHSLHIEQVHIVRSAYAYLKYLFSFGPLYYSPDPTYYKNIVWTGKDVNISLISYFLSGLGFIQIPAKDYYFKFRYFFPSEESFHVIVSKSANGYSVRAHIDIEEHKKALSNKLTFELLSSLSFFLRSECPTTRLFMKPLPYDIPELPEETSPTPSLLPKREPLPIPPHVKKVVVKPSPLPEVKEKRIVEEIPKKPVVEMEDVSSLEEIPVIDSVPELSFVHSPPVSKPRSRFFPHGKPTVSKHQTCSKQPISAPTVDNKYLRELEGLVYGAMPRNPERIVPSPKKTEKIEIIEKRKPKERPRFQGPIDYAHVQREIAKVVRRYGRTELENIKKHAEPSIAYQDVRKVLLYCYYGAKKNVDPRVTVICDVEFEEYLKRQLKNDYELIFNSSQLTPTTIKKKVKKTKKKVRLVISSRVHLFFVLLLDALLIFSFFYFFFLPQQVYWLILNNVFLLVLIPMVIVFIFLLNYRLYLRKRGE